MIDIKSINFNSTNDNFTKLYLSFIITLYLYCKIIINPYIVKRFAFGEKFSEMMREYYINNIYEGSILDFLNCIALFFTVFKVFNMNVIKNDRYNNFFYIYSLLISILLLKMFIFKFIINFYKGKSGNIEFFKEWLNSLFNETFVWNLLYYTSIFLVYLFISINNFNLFYPILLSVLGIGMDILLK